MSLHRMRLFFIATLLALSAISTAMLAPSAPSAGYSAPDLEAMLPEAFGVWRRVPISTAVLPQETSLTEGEAVAYRAYQDDLGRVVTLVAAYGPPRGDSVRLHRPETCYVAQGFSIRARAVAEFDDRGVAIPIVTLDAESPSRREAVSYWLREGSTFTTGSGDGGWRRLRRGVAKPLDGALLRVSTTTADAARFDLHREFLASFAHALDAPARAILLGKEKAG